MKIAIVKLSALGDIVHAMVILQFIKKYNPEIKVDWVVEENYKELLECNPDINEVHSVKIKKARNKKSLYLFFSELKKIKQLGPYDLVIDLQGLIKSALISKLIESNITLGFDKFSVREFLAAKLYNKKYKMDYAKNVIERNLAITSNALNFLVVSDEVYQKDFFLYASKDYEFYCFSENKPNIALVLGASYDSKCYPVENFAEIVRQIDAKFIVIWGTNKEKKLSNDLKKLTPNIEICEKFSLDKLISFVSKLDLLIGPDTGPTHMAWALNIPSITLFGPTPGKRNAYETRINKIIESESFVDPSSIDKTDYSIKNINSNEIVKMTNSLIKNKK